MPTIKDIIKSPEVKDTDKYDTQMAMSILSDKVSYYSCLPEQPSTCIKRVAYKSYDCERVAYTDVLYFNKVPFAVVSCAGRGGEDWQDAYVFDKEYADKAVAEFSGENIYTEVSLEDSINLAYWEGRKIYLGDNE